MRYNTRPWVDKKFNIFAKNKLANINISLAKRIKKLTVLNKFIHEKQCFNLNPATNIMNPKAEQLLSSSLSTRVSLGYPGDKYEMGLEAVEEIELITSQLACEVFDAAHQCGMIAGRAWKNPLKQGAHLMSMSTYKSLGGPASGLIVSNNAKLMKRIDAIAFPGLSANFDVASSAALAITLLDWIKHGKKYATAMIKTAQSLAKALTDEGIPVFCISAKNNNQQASKSHQFAIIASSFGGGQKMAKSLRKANILSSGIGLPISSFAKNINSFAIETMKGQMNGLRLGTPELVRIGMKSKDMPRLASLIADNILKRRANKDIAKELSLWRASFKKLEFIN